MAVKNVLLNPFAPAIFLSAFLLFQLQPIIARFILPAYGGSASVWTACMMFFQVALLGGYLYAYLLVKYVPQKRQPLVHLALLSLSLLLLPIGTPESWTPMLVGQPALEILALLAISIGLPFLLISASGPLLQHWFAGAYQGRSPFRLYALSNLGSLMALLSYPVLIEPLFNINMQTKIWSYGYFGLVTICIACGVTYFKRGAVIESVPGAADTGRPITALDRLLWVALAACASTMLLAITNQISQDVAVVPFLWILPLSLYLISFIICFDKDAWYRRIVWLPVLFVALGLVLYLLFHEFGDHSISLATELGIYSLTLFASCMVCHGELVRRRSAASHLTTFYLYVALGGALGGVFVNLLAPLLFTGFWELHGALVATVVLAGICLAMDKNLMTSQSRWFAFLAIWLLSLAVIVVLLIQQVQESRQHSIFVSRSFFGVLYVDEFEAGTRDHDRTFYHGRIQHGMQQMHHSRQHLATSYYGTGSGVWAAIENHPQRFAEDSATRGIRIGAVGLGVATISVMGTAQDSLRYYEINPQVRTIAETYFTYLSNGQADTEFVIGDARISMQKELDAKGSNTFDVLVLDAFSGDSVPVHLLTAEAFELYAQHLSDSGVLAVHVSNQYLDLARVVLGGARHIGMNSVLIVDSGESWYHSSTDWILISANQQFLDSIAVRSIVTAWTDQPEPILWTDRFSNLLQIVDWTD